MENHELPETLAFVKEPWFWWTAGILAAACVGLIVAYYVKHPDRNIWSDFTHRGIADHATTNGHVPGAATRPGVDVVEGMAPQSEG